MNCRCSATGTQKPVIDFIQTKVDKKWIDMALNAAKDAEKD